MDTVGVMGAHEPRGHQTILVVDDEASIGSLLERLLDRAGFSIAVASDGASALEQVARVSPDVVLLDILMPGELDGFAVCRRERSNPRRGSRRS